MDKTKLFPGSCANKRSAMREQSNRALHNAHVALVVHLLTWLSCGRVITSILITVISRLRGRALRIAPADGEKELESSPGSLFLSHSRLLFGKCRIKEKREVHFPHSRIVYHGMEVDALHKPAESLLIEALDGRRSFGGP